MLVAIKGDLGHPLSATEQEMIVSATTVGAIVGSIVASRAADWLGRKRVIVIAALLFLLGSLEQAASQDVPQLVLGRFLVGVAVGQSASVVPLYLAEVAPTTLRGRIVSTNCLLITGGQVIAYLVNAALSSLRHSWRWMVLASAMPAILQLLGLLTLDESPRWLVNRGRYAHARKVMKKIYPSAIESQVEAMVDRIIDSLTTRRAHQETSTDAEEVSASHKPSRWALLFKDPANRRALMLAAGLQAFQQGVGFNAIMYYSSRILVVAGFTAHPNVFATFIAIANFLGTLGAIRLVDSWGRRRLLLFMTPLMACSLAVLAVSFQMLGNPGDVTDDPTSIAMPPPAPSSIFDRPQVHDMTNAADPLSASPQMFARTYIFFRDSTSSPSGWAVCSLVSMIVYTLFYALGQGIVPWLVLSEVFSGQVRSLGSGIASSANWSVNLIWSASFLSMVEKLGPANVFGFFVLVSAAAWAFAYAMLPELTGVDINDVGRAFESTTSRRQQRDDRQRSVTATANAHDSHEERHGLLAGNNDSETH